MSPRRSAAVRLLGFVSLLLAGWCVMTFTHELGHLLGGWLGGGELRSAWLGPWPPPSSQFQPDPHPALTLWAGPLFGTAAPAFLATFVPRTWPGLRRRAWFLADFCLLANGSYLAVAWTTGDRLLDTPRMFRAGVSPVGIAAFCLLACGVGYVRFRNDCWAVWDSERLPRGTNQSDEGGTPSGQ
ncbi:MAG: hypothetical protein AAF907_02660 [Planctomycetota bacterium]